MDKVKKNPTYADATPEQQRAEARTQMVGEVGSEQLNKSFAKKLKQAVEEAIKWIADKFGVSLKDYTPEQILNLRLNDLVKASLGSARRGEFAGRDSGETFQMTMPDGATRTVRAVNAEVVNGFYSPIENAVHEIRQEKGTGEQMLAMRETTQQGLPQFQKTSEHKPIEKRKFDKLIDRLKKAFPKVTNKIVVGQERMQKGLKELSKMGHNVQFITHDSEVLGFVDPINGKVYLNDAKMNANTPIHEIVGHTFLNTLKTTNPKAYNEIMSKLQSEKALMDEVRNDPNYAHLKTDEQIADELFARMVGNEGERMFNEMQDRNLAHRIKDVIADLWEKFKYAVGKNPGYKNIKEWSVEDFKNASLGEIIDNLNKNALKGKEVLPDTTDIIAQQKADLGIQYDMLEESDFNKDGTVKESVLKEIAEEEAEIRKRADFMKAPNGKKSNLNEKQWVQVRTKRFKKWFGDWINDPTNASKVVDENGEPLVVYHGTGTKFDTFDKAKATDEEGRSFGVGTGKGIFSFTNDKRTGENWAERSKERGKFGVASDSPNVINAFLNLKNPISRNEFEKVSYFLLINL